MKKKKTKLLCDIIAEDNLPWFNKLETVVGQEEVMTAVLQEITEKAIKQGVSQSLLEDTIFSSLENQNNVCKYTKILCLNNWYHSGRQVYKFDDTLSELLQEQAKEDLKIDSSILEQLPISHFYVIRKSKKDPSSDGFFFSYMNNMVYIYDTSKTDPQAVCTTRIESGKTISEGFLDGIKSFSNANEIAIIKKNIKDIASEISNYMQFVVYLSAINSEVVPITKGAIVKKQASKREYVPREKTELSEVGYRVGSTIRKALSNESREKVVYIGEHGKGAPKTPHIRRSHFHSYWTGSGDNKTIEVINGLTQYSSMA